MAMNRKRYLAEDVQNNQFYQLPKFLFEGEFVKMSNDARVLYSLLRDRHSLSLQNGWINKNNEVYLVYSRDEMCEMLNVSKPTVTKIVNELKKLGLIEEERLGQGKANLIYLTAVTLDMTRKEKNFTSRNKDFLPQDIKNFSPNKTDSNKTREEEAEKAKSENQEITAEEKQQIVETYISLIGNKFENEMPLEDMLWWLEQYAKKFGTYPVLYAIARLKEISEREDVDTALGLVYTIALNSLEFPPRVSSKKPKAKGKQQPPKTNYREKVYDSTLMGS